MKKGGESYPDSEQEVSNQKGLINPHGTQNRLPTTERGDPRSKCWVSAAPEGPKISSAARWEKREATNS